MNSGIVAWRQGRGFSMWHLTSADLWQTLCGLAVPTKPLDTVSRIRGRDRSPTCAKCLRVLNQAQRLEIVK